MIYRRKASGRFGRAETPFDPMDFLARLLMHIPQPRLHTVRYYGHYSSVARARRCAPQRGEADEALNLASTAELPTTAERRRLRRAWAQMIRRIYEVDPLTCSCGARMRILAFILDPQVVAKILRHLATGEPTRHRAAAQQRAPPVPAVASSPLER